MDFSTLFPLENPDENQISQNNLPMKTNFTSEVKSEFNSINIQFSSIQSLSRVRLCDPMNRSMSGLLVHHQFPEFTQTHVHRMQSQLYGRHCKNTKNKACSQHIAAHTEMGQNDVKITTTTTKHNTLYKF